MEKLSKESLLRGELKELEEEELNLLTSLANNNFDAYDQRRLDDIHKEMAEIRLKINKPN
ncbi:hypothetical protein [Pantoea anthophila]|uniref:hypothetical protein n=1 Tax=Pantoea anthophila TaxID=470931 RepID=UPI003018570F